MTNCTAPVGYLLVTNSWSSSTRVVDADGAAPLSTLRGANLAPSRSNPMPVPHNASSAMLFGLAAMFSSQFPG